MFSSINWGTQQDEGHRCQHYTCGARVFTVKHKSQTLMFKATHVRTQLPKTIKLNQENAILVDLKGFKFLHSHFLYIQNSKAHRLITLKNVVIITFNNSTVTITFNNSTVTVLESTWLSHSGSLTEGLNWKKKSLTEGTSLLLVSSCGRRNAHLIW